MRIKKDNSGNKDKKKKRGKYETKLKVTATFDEMLKLMASKPKKRTVKKQGRKPN